MAGSSGGNKNQYVIKVCIHKARIGGNMEVMLLGAANSRNVLLCVAKKKKGCYVIFKVKKGNV